MTETLILIGQYIAWLIAIGAFLYFTPYEKVRRWGETFLTTSAKVPVYLFVIATAGVALVLIDLLD
jgi:hypothetical protein